MSYRDEYQRSIENPEDFWREKAEALPWFSFPETMLGKDDNGIDRWFTDGSMNTAHMALDHHVENGRGEQAAIIYDSPVTGTKRSISYQELLEPGICNADEDCAAGEYCEPNTCVNPYAPCYGQCHPGQGGTGQAGDPCGQDADCDQDLFCKQLVDGEGTCQGELWCAPATVEADCANVVHIMVPGSWSCEDSLCAWQTEGVSGGTFFSADTPLGIPDNDVEGIDSSIEVSGLPECNLTVSVDVVIRHSYSGDLVVGLTDPSGSRVILHNREGAGADDVVIQDLSLTGTLGTWVDPSGEGNVSFAVGLFRAVVFCWIPLYLLISLKRVYQQGWGMTVLKYSAIGTSYLFLLALATLFVVLLSFVLL